MPLSDAIANVKADDERVRITEYRLPPGSHTGWYRHGMAYVVVPTQGRSEEHTSELQSH